MGILGSIFKHVASIVTWVFGKVIDLVLGVAAFPILGSITALLNVVLYAITSLFTILSHATTGIFLLTDLGTGEFFTEMFQLESFYQILIAFSYALLFVIYLFGLFQIMVSQDTSSLDSPGSLTAKVFVAGCMVPLLRPAMNIGITFFQTLISAMAESLTGTNAGYLSKMPGT